MSKVKIAAAEMLLVFCPVVKTCGSLYTTDEDFFFFQSKHFALSDKAATQMGIPDLMGKPGRLHRAITFLTPWRRQSLQLNVPATAGAKLYLPFQTWHMQRNCMCDMTLTPLGWVELIKRGTSLGLTPQFCGLLCQC